MQVMEGGLFVRGYQLTERGKILIAVILALLIFVLPSAILAFKALASQPPPPSVDRDSETSGSPPPSTSETPPNGTAESPPPNGGGFNPPEGSGEPDGDNEPGDYNRQDGGDDPGDSDDLNGNGGSAVSAPPDEHEPESPPQSGPIGSNPTAGSLTFSFSPSSQDALDDETVALLREFLASANNTDGSRIAIEIPRLSAEAADKVISATVNAFAAQGVPTQRLEFIAGQRVPAGSSFTVRLSYIWPQSK